MKILFKVFPQKSHYNATFLLAKALRDGGHEVIYAGLIQMRSHAEAQGFAYHVQAEDVFPHFENRHDLPRLSFWNILKNWREIRRSARAARPKIERGGFFAALLHETCPDLILVDSPYTFHALTLYNHKVPFAMLESMMNLDRAPGIPPMDTTYVPDGSVSGNWLCALHWRRYFLKRALLGFLGLRADFDRRFVLRMACVWAVDPHVISFNRYFHLGLRNVPEIILSPRALDFPRALAPNQYYVGASVDLDRQEAASDYLFDRVFRRMVIMRADERPLVYCCLGTGAWRYTGAEDFLRRVILASRSQHWNLIIACGDFATEQFSDLPENVAIFKVVPQMVILDHADLMITHGGMNSITECITFGVPMLVYPGTSEIDQPGNAARVVFHGIGIEGRLASDCSDRIADNIKYILNNRDYSRRALALRDELRSVRHKLGALIGKISSMKFVEAMAASEAALH